MDIIFHKSILRTDQGRILSMMHDRFLSKIGQRWEQVIKYTKTMLINQL